MRKQFCIANKKGKSDETESDDDDKNEAKSEAALTNANGGKSHRRKLFKGKCFECGLSGHQKKDCWELEENAHKRPQWWKSRKTKQQTEMAGTELCLASMRQDFGSAC